ncbi:MAG TPA: hypothetical protein VGP82_23945 [Ktedonobacterales bacterium]|nr:hypothetical protein [Ktedonobacterales bacterium]
MPMMYYGTTNWGTMFLMMLMNSVVWIALIGLLVWGVSRLFTNRTSAARPVDAGLSAQEILRQRYARGEIAGANFDEMMRHIEATAPPQGVRS